MTTSSTDVAKLVAAKDSNGVVEYVKNVLLDSCGEDDDVTALKKASEFFKVCATKAAGKSEALNKAKMSGGGGMGELLLSADNLQFLEPRGRFNARFYERGMTMENKSFCGTVMWENTLTVMCILSTLTAKKDTEDLIVVHFTPEKINGKILKNVLFAASRLGECELLGGDVKGSMSEVLQQLISASTGRPVSRPSPAIFSSAKGLPFVRGYYRIQEGSVYLLDAGILFLRPVIFVPVREVASVMAGRGGAATTRYIDLKVETEDGDEFEFSNLERDELGGIQNYVQYLSEAREKRDRLSAAADPTPGAAPGQPSSALLAAEDLDDDESDDDDYDPYEIRERERGAGSATDEDSDSDSDGDSDDSACGSGSGSDDSGFVSEGSVHLSGAEDDELLREASASARSKRTRNAAVATESSSSSVVTASRAPGKWHMATEASSSSSSAKRPRLEETSAADQVGVTVVEE